MSVVFTASTGGTAYTAYLNGITLTKKSNNKITPVKGSSPVIVRLGKTATVSVTFRCYGDTDFATITAWGGETAIVVSSSSYAELPNGNYLLKNFESKQKPGNLQNRDIKFDLEYYYTGAII
jgi:hypothetical protein